MFIHYTSTANLLHSFWGKGSYTLYFAKLIIVMGLVCITFLSENYTNVSNNYIFSNFCVTVISILKRNEYQLLMRHGAWRQVIVVYGIACVAVHHIVWMLGNHTIESQYIKRMSNVHDTCGQWYLRLAQCIVFLIFLCRQSEKERQCWMDIDRLNRKLRVLPGILTCRDAAVSSPTLKSPGCDMIVTRILCPGANATHSSFSQM